MKNKVIIQKVVSPMLDLQRDQDHKVPTRFNDCANLHRMKKLRALSMLFFVNCATIVDDLASGHRVSLFIEHEFSQIRYNLKVNHQSLWFYIQCNR